MTDKCQPSKMGRPLAVIDWGKVDAMCAIHCTAEEIASILDVNYSTLERACKRENKRTFADYLREKSQHGKASLRRRQWKLAEGGNATMQIWLGKQWLGQSDSPGDPDKPPPTIIINMPKPDGD